MEKEIWKDIPGYEGKYQVSIDIPEGKCRRFYKNGKVREFSSKPHKREGRLYWSLCKDGTQTTWQAARWIALTYPELVTNEWFPGAEIDHIDTNRLNNHPSNLRWVSHKENQNNPLTKQHIGEGHLNRPDQSLWVIKLSKDNEILHFYPSAHQASRETGVGRSHISECCRGERKSAGGFTWKYAE